jgi:hypothetical protein
VIRRILPRSLRRWVRARSLRLAESLSEFDAARYWESRYAAGGTSGEGSYGRLADFKAKVINDFVAEHDVHIAIEFGCGDGNQLSLLRVPRYIGLDISASAVRRCIERFSADGTKSFFLFDAKSFRDTSGVFAADLVMSLDVIYHLVSDEEFEAYMRHACTASRRYLMLYTTDADSEEAGHQRHRAVSKWMQRRSDFVSVRRVENPYAGSEDGHERSDAAFLIYERVAP